jgi:hypothetical protein
MGSNVIPDGFPMVTLVTLTIEYFHFAVQPGIKYVG